MTELKRLRLELTRHMSDLVLVGDRMEEGGRYVQTEIPHVDSALWTSEQWADLYDKLERTWEKRYGS